MDGSSGSSNIETVSNVVSIPPYLGNITLLQALRSVVMLPKRRLYPLKEHSPGLSTYSRDRQLPGLVQLSGRVKRGTGQYTRIFNAVVTLRLRALGVSWAHVFEQRLEIS